MIYYPNRRGGNTIKKLILFILCLIPLSTYALNVPEVRSDKYLVYDLTEDKVIIEKDSQEESAIASLTKIATTITAIENSKDLSRRVTITKEMLDGIQWDASVANLKVGEVYTIEDLLYASMLPSGADATQALAIETSGSIEAFVEKMNDLVKRIGAKSTHFVNTSGLDAEGHYSTPEDVLTILKYALKNDIFKTVFTAKKYTMTTNRTVYSTLTMYNRNMNLDISRVLGSKTGYTDDAGRCLAALISSYGHDIMIITLGSIYENGIFYNLKDAITLMEFIDDNYKSQVVVKKGDLIGEIPVGLSKTVKYKVYSKEDLESFLPINYDEDDIHFVYEGSKDLSLMDFFKRGAGKIKYYYGNILLKEEAVNLGLRAKMIIILGSWMEIAVLGEVAYLLFINSKKSKKKGHIELFQ